MRKLRSMRSKKGRPPHSTTGVASSSSTSPCARGERKRPTRWPGSIAPIASASSGSVSSGRHAQAAAHVLEARGSARRPRVTARRLERHAADPARAGTSSPPPPGPSGRSTPPPGSGQAAQPGLARPGRHRRRPRPGLQPVVGVLRETLAAAGAAEGVGRAAVREGAAARRARVHLHAAHRVGHEAQLAAASQRDGSAVVAHAQP